MNNKSRSLGIRFLLSISSLMLIAAVIYILVASINLASSLILISAISGLVIPSVMSGDGILEYLVGTLEAFVEGIQSVLELIADVFSSIFSA